MRFFCLILFIFMTKVLIGQSICGKVSDIKSGEPLSMAHVIFKQNKEVVNGVVSDVNGQYTFEVPNQGIYDVEVSYLGYKTQIYKNIDVNKVDTNLLNIALEADVYILNDIVIEHKAPTIDTDRIGCFISKSEISSKAIRGVGGIRSLHATNLYSTFNSNFGTIDLKSMSSGQTIDFINPVFFPNDLSPLSSNESYAQTSENPYYNSRLNPVSTFSIDVDRASYTNIRRFINQGEKPVKDAVRLEEMVNYFNYNYQKPTDGIIETYTELSACPWNSKSQLLHIGLQSKVSKVDSLKASNFVFLIDVSGSMHDHNKLPLVKATLKMVTQKMKNDDKISIVVYAGEAGCVLESTSGENKNKIIEALNHLEAGGSTAGGEGIELAYRIALNHFIKGGNNRIILATDGDFNVGVSSNESLELLIEEKRKSNVFLTVLGYGMGNYKDDKLELLANKGNGNYAYIDNKKEAEEFLVNGFYSTLYTLAKDVKLQLKFNPKYIQSYRLIGYENRILANTDFKDDTKDAGELGSDQSVTAIYEIIPTKKGQKTDLEFQNIKESSQLFNLKIRYKTPEGRVSKIIEKSIKRQYTAFSETSDRFRFSASVAMFGLLIKDSKYKMNASFDKVIELAEKATLNDNTYQQDFIGMVQNYMVIDGQ